MHALLVRLEVAWTSTISISEGLVLPAFVAVQVLTLMRWDALTTHTTVIDFGVTLRAMCNMRLLVLQGTKGINLVLPQIQHAPALRSLNIRSNYGFERDVAQSMFAQPAPLALALQASTRLLNSMTVPQSDGGPSMCLKMTHIYGHAMTRVHNLGPRFFLLLWLDEVNARSCEHQTATFTHTCKKN
jgi:hypothetical protein